MTMFRVLPESSHSKATLNPIRNFIEGLKVPKGTPEKKLIPLSVGDPTIFGNLKAPDALIKAVQSSTADYNTHGYKHSTGMENSRAAVAKRCSNATGRNVVAEDIFLTNGCSGALDIAIRALCSAGDNILLPSPMFPLYATIANAAGVEVRTYPLVPERNWEANIDALDKLIDRHTGAILINNPSNPCGSVYSKEHLLDIISIAEKRGVPIISDEIYGNLTFKGFSFHPLASLTKSVPILEVGGLSKEFLVPGFRMGWIVVYDAPAEDNRTAFECIRPGILKLTQVLVGPNAAVQGALPRLLLPRENSSKEEAAEFESFHIKTVNILEENGNFLANRLQRIPGLSVTLPQGAMYVMIGLDLNGAVGPDGVEMDDESFCRLLLQEEYVFLLPGKCFGLKNFCRAVFCAPIPILSDACDRIEKFCSKLKRNQ